MKQTFKKYFIPHEGNNYHPHILHTKRIVWYSGLFIAIKIIVLIFVAALPLRAFLLPDVLLEQEQKILAMTNDLRRQKGLPQLVDEDRLDASARHKAQDMAVHQYFSHKGPDGKTVQDWLKETGYFYKVAGENLAMGFPSAEEVVNAWIKSPTHYVNLIDPDYEVVGVGLESGLYNGQETVYLAEHFAAPQQIQESPKITATRKNKEKPTLAVETVPEIKKAPLPASSEQVLSVKVDDGAGAVFFDPDNSKVFWQDKGDKTLLTVEAKISGPIKSAVVEVGHYPIELTASGEGVYYGEYLALEPADNFFRIVISPTISIISLGGQTIVSNINWQTIKTVEPTPIQKYIRARESLSSVTNIFAVSKNIYFVFIAFFALALILNIVIEIKKQHPHIIFQTLGLLGLLICFWLV